MLNRRGLAAAAAGALALTGTALAVTHSPERPAPRVTAVQPPTPTPGPSAKDPVPSPLNGGLVAHARTILTVYNRPHGTVTDSFGVRTPLGGPQAVLVAKLIPGWVMVRLPVRPNTRTGWVPRSQVTITSDPWSIAISRTEHVLTVRKNGNVTARYPVAVGAPSTPTPIGVFFVTDLIHTGNPGGAYGPAALGLSGHSEVLTSFAGGDGVVGIHGTNEQSSIGKSVSHGCIRMRNADSLTLLRTVPIGTPVLIS